jgi:hypothetical protein
MLHRLGNVRVESERLRHVAAGFANDAVVIHDREIEKICPLDSRGIRVVRAGKDSYFGRD